MSRQILLFVIVGLASAGIAAGLVFALNRGGVDQGEVQELPPPKALLAPPAPETPAAKPAPVAPPTPEPARVGSLIIPKDGGVWPWPIAATPPEAPSVPVSFTQIVHSKDPKDWKNRVKIQAARVNPVCGRAVVTASGFDPQNRPKEKISWGEVYFCDLTQGRVTQQWETKQDMYPFDIHPDGNRFLLRYGHAGYDLATQVLELWEMGKENTIRRRTWRPHYDGKINSSNVLGFSENPKHHVPEAQVKWAGFVGYNHIATLTGSRLRLWDAKSLKLEAGFSGIVGLPAVTPDGGKLAFLHGDAVLLLDPESFRIVSAKRLGELPLNPVLAFHASGQKLAAVGSGRTVILELNTGKVWSAMLADIKREEKGHDWVELPPACGWAGDRHIFYQGDLYDLDMPVPVWHYSWAAWANIQGRSAWAVADMPRDKDVVLRPYTIPHPGMQAALHKMLLISDVFELRPGDRVSLDVSGLPKNRQESMQASLEKRILALGYVLDPSARVVFRATLDKAAPASINYSGTNYSYTAQPARLVIERAGKKLWDAIGCHWPPMLIWYSSDSRLADVVKTYGGPDYEVFTHRPIPGVIRKPGKTGALGHSSFRANGIEDK